MNTASPTTLWSGLVDGIRVRIVREPEPPDSPFHQDLVYEELDQDAMGADRWVPFVRGSSVIDHGIKLRRICEMALREMSDG